MINKNGLIVIDYSEKRIIYSEWTEHEYIFFHKDIEKNYVFEYTIGIKYEKIRADGKILARGLISVY